MNSTGAPFSVQRGQPRRWPRRLALAAVLTAGTGCRDSGSPPVVSVYEVKGKVILADGKPLSGGHIYFVPKDGAVTSEGVIGRDGTFSLVTANSGEGAPPGAYKVRVEPGDRALLAAGRPARRLPFPARYLDEDRSGLVVTTRAEPNLLQPFRLK